jgi:hypothetical protein
MTLGITGTDELVDDLVALHNDYSGLFEHAREKWEETRPKEGGGRKENYWQGKKDGVRPCLNLLSQILRKYEIELE